MKKIRNTFSLTAIDESKATVRLPKISQSPRRRKPRKESPNDSFQNKRVTASRTQASLNTKASTVRELVESINVTSDM